MANHNKKAHYKAKGDLLDDLIGTFTKGLESSGNADLNKIAANSRILHEVYKEAKVLGEQSLSKFVDILEQANDKANCLEAGGAWQDAECYYDSL
jgi:hypothetical protein